MVCKGCYTNLPPGVTVCEVCGKEPPTTPCPQCKTPVHEGRRFCPNCRARVEKALLPKIPAPVEMACPQCQAPLAPHRRFCNQCGTRQGQGNIKIAPPPQETASPSLPRRENRPIRLGTGLEKLEKTKQPRPSASLESRRDSLTNSPSPSPRPRRESLANSPSPSPRPRRESLANSPSLSPRPRRESLENSPSPNPRPRRESLTDSPSPSPRPRRESLANSPSPNPRPNKETAEKTKKLLQTCPHCQEKVEESRRICPSCHKRIQALPVGKNTQKSTASEKAPLEKTAQTPPSPPKKTEFSLENSHISPSTKPFRDPELISKPKVRAPRRFCPECYSQVEGEVCQFCIDHPPLPPFPTLVPKKSVQPPKIAVVAASVAGVALCMGLGQMILSEEDEPLGSDNQVDVNLQYPSNSSQPSRPTESGEILPEAVPELPEISNATDLPTQEEIPENTNPPQEDSNETTTPHIYPQEEDSAETTPQVYPQEENPISASGVCEDPTIHGIYRPILHSYGYGLEFSWTEDHYSDANLNPDMAHQSFSNASYTFWDIDGNGTPELIIGSPETGGLIMELYTVSNGQLTLLLRGNDRERYVLCQDGLIAHDDNKGNVLTLELRGNYLTIVADHRQKDPFYLTDEAKIPFTSIAEYYFG